jgi:hypothetical protein
LEADMQIGCADRLRSLFDSHLTDAEASVHITDWRQGNLGIAMLTAMVAYLEPILAERMKDTDRDAIGRLLDHPQLTVQGDPLYLFSGRRTPGTGDRTGE